MPLYWLTKGAARVWCGTTLPTEPMLIPVKGAIKQCYASEETFQTSPSTSVTGQELFKEYKTHQASK